MSAVSIIHPTDILDAFDHIVSTKDVASCAMILLTRGTEWSESNENTIRKCFEVVMVKRPELVIYCAVVAPPLSRDQMLLYKLFTNVQYVYACQNYSISLITGLDHATLLQFIPKISEFAVVW